MRELIKHILKESRLKQELKQVIEDNGIFDAIDMVGGIKNFKKVFKNDPEVAQILDGLTGVVDSIRVFPVANLGRISDNKSMEKQIKNTSHAFSDALKEIEQLRLANSDLQMHYDHARTECDKLLEVLKELEWQLKNQLYDAAYETVIYTLWPALKEKE